MSPYSTFQVTCDKGPDLFGSELNVTSDRTVGRNTTVSAIEIEIYQSTYNSLQFYIMKKSMFDSTVVIWKRYSRFQNEACFSATPRLGGRAQQQLPCNHP